MATTTAGRNFAIGFEKQSAVVNGSTVTTANSPTISATTYTWPRWLQGSLHYPEGQYNHEWEGDGSRGESLSYKRFQVGKANLTCYPRPAELIALLAAFTGGNSLWTGQASVASLDAASLDATVLEPTTTTASTIWAPGNDVGNDYYTIASLLRGTSYTLKTADALCHGFTLSAGVGQPFKVATDWSGGANITGDAIPSASLHVDPNGPFFFFDGQWNISDALGNVLNISPAVRDFNLRFETTLNPEDYQAEGIFPLPLAAGNLTVSGEITVLWQDAQAMNLAYFGSATAPATADVSSTIASRSGFGNLVLQLHSSGIWDAGATPAALEPNNNFFATFEFPAANYEGVTFEPDLSGKPIEQKVMLHMTKSAPGLVVKPADVGSVSAATYVPYAVTVDTTPTT